MKKTEPTDEDYKAFLKDLAKMVKKYNIAIGGCGCCGSPFLYVPPSKSGHYTVRENSDLEFHENDTAQEN